jgi:hypothetical protein
MKAISFSLVVIFLVGFSGLAVADDLVPPPWDRAHPRATVQEWDFLTIGLGPIEGPVGFEHWQYDAPDGTLSDNPMGDAVLRVWPGTGQYYWPELDGRDGVWPLSGTIEVEVPNFPELLEEKIIWIQLTWQPQAPGNVPTVWETTYDIDAVLVSEDILEGFWTHSVYEIILPENPQFEIVRIDGGIDVDQLVIDTLCIPEPATLGLLGMGALALIRRKRK